MEPNLTSQFLMVVKIYWLIFHYKIEITTDTGDVDMVFQGDDTSIATAKV